LGLEPPRRAHQPEKHSRERFGAVPGVADESLVSELRRRHGVALDYPPSGTRSQLSRSTAPLDEVEETVWRLRRTLERLAGED
jgi:hypothetical protein